MGLFTYSLTRMFTNDFDNTNAVAASTEGSSFVDRNWQTTAAVGLTVATGGVVGAVALAAFPAQTLVAGTTIGGLFYAGDRKAKGLEVNPFAKRGDKTEATDEPAASAA